MPPTIEANDFQTVLRHVSKDHIASCDKRMRADDMVPITARSVWKYVLKGDTPEDIANRLHISETYVKGLFRDICIRTGLLFQKQAERWYLTATGRGHLVNSQIGDYIKQRERASKFAAIGK